MTDPLHDHELPALLKSSEETSSGDPEQHLDLVALAEYLDGALEDPAAGGPDRAANTGEKERVESHLAACVSCRELAMEVAASLRTTPPSRKPQLRYLAVAAAVVACLAIWLVSGLSGPDPSGIDPRLKALGVDTATFLQASPTLQAITLAALNGQWPPVVGLDDLTNTPTPALRSANNAHKPQPASPRWTVLGETRPTFVWYPAPRSDEPANDQLLLVDEDEQLVATLEPTPRISGEYASKGPPSRLTFPPSLPPLQPGKLYAWKVNSQVDGEPEASIFVPFRIQDIATATQLGQELPLALGEPILETMVFARHGLYQRAMETLSAAALPPEGKKIRAALAGSLLRQMMQQEDLLRWEQRRFGVEEEPP